MQAVERQKNERKKIEQYHSDLFANKQINRDIKEAHIALIEYKGNMFKKIFNDLHLSDKVFFFICLITKLVLYKSKSNCSLLWI